MTEIDKLKLKLEFAADIMKRLPRVKVKGYGSSWPETLYTLAEIMEQEPERSRPQATSREVSQMEEILTWLKPLDAFETKLVWKRACRVPWKILSYDFQSNRTTLWRKYDRALVKVLGEARLRVGSCRME